MTVLDTHAWLWWVDGDPRLSPAARAAIESDTEAVVSAISVWELATLERLGRLTLLPDIRTWIRRALVYRGIAAQTVTPEVALAAGSLIAPFPGDPADRIIYATALATETRLVSADRRLATLDPDRVVW
jgi:PIN domain nuclease of toxin-antitoxin system